MEPIWATLLAKALEGKNVKELLSNVGAGGGAPATGSGLAAVSAGGQPAAEAEPEAKEEEKEESDDDMVRSSLLVFSILKLIDVLGLWSFRLTLHLFRFLFSFLYVLPIDIFSVFHSAQVLHWYHVARKIIQRRFIFLRN
jgi:hypothetical protein